MSTTIKQVLVIDRPNANGRTYPREVIEKALGEYMKFVMEKRAVGTLCLDHESVNWLDERVMVNLNDASHLVTEIGIENGFVIAHIETLETEKGKLLAKMIEDGTAEFRTSGLGTMNEKGVINMDYKLLSISAMPVTIAAPLIDESPATAGDPDQTASEAQETPQTGDGS